MARQNSLLGTSILSADGGERKGESFSELCVKKESAGMAGLRKGRQRKSNGSFIGFSEINRSGWKRGATERGIEWQRRNDQDGEELLRE